MAQERRVNEIKSTQWTCSVKENVMLSYPDSHSKAPQLPTWTVTHKIYIFNRYWSSTHQTYHWASLPISTRKGNLDKVLPS